jgi:UDP-glucose:(heptosyl)LPS alpha-1,3-glucosyltransferase
VEGRVRNGDGVIDAATSVDLLRERLGAAPANTLAFLLLRYFPHGGLQRDFLRIATACAARGYFIRVYTLVWEGEQPAGRFEVFRVPQRGLTNHRRAANFADWVAGDLARHPTALRIGFNKMPGLDVYYAADTCFAAKSRERKRLQQLSSRHRVFSRLERAVFAPDAATRILLITALQQPVFQHWYGTPDARFTVLPPPLAPERRRPDDAAAIRAGFRTEHGLADADLVVLTIASAFGTKGVDRSLRAIAALPGPLRQRVRYFVVGADEPGRFAALARQLGIAGLVTWSGGRDDVERFLLGADLLLHPARVESGGVVLLEALAAGLPSLATDVCGFAPIVAEADAGVTLVSPFGQADLDRALASVLSDRAARARWSANGVAFGKRPELYGMAERAADLIGAWASGHDVPA